MVDRRVPRVQSVVLPILRAAFPDVLVTTWVPDVDRRTYPLLNVRRIGGTAIDPKRLDRASLEVMCFSASSLAAAEDLCLDARWVLSDAVDTQASTDVGYLHSFAETSGPTQIASTFEDTWTVQAIFQLGVRPPRRSN